MRQRFTYDCVLIKEDDGYCASFPQIPGAFADFCGGEDPPGRGVRPAPGGGGRAKAGPSHLCGPGLSGPVSLAALLPVRCGGGALAGGETQDCPHPQRF